MLVGHRFEWPDKVDVFRMVMTATLERVTSANCDGNPYETKKDPITC